MTYLKVMIGVLTAAWIGAAAAQELTIQDKAAVDLWSEMTYGQARSPNDPMGDTAMLQALAKNELRGAYTFKQHCNVCHERDQSLGTSYGPRITKDSLVDREDFIRDQIMNGSTNMPAFKYALQSAQVADILSYLKKVPSPCYDCKIGDFRRAVPLSE